MTSTTRSIDGRTLRRASVALIGAALLAACDSDRAVSPKIGPTKDSASAKPFAAPLTGNLVIKTGGPNGSLLVGGSYTIQTSIPTFMSITDGGPGDEDSAQGTITIKNISWPYDVIICQTAVVVGYEIDHEPCRTTRIYSNYTQVVDFFSPPYYSASWDVRLARNGYIAFPSAFSLSSGRAGGVLPIPDNGVNDIDPRWGHLTVKLGAASVFTLCQTMATGGFYVASPACRTVDARSGRGVWAGTFFEPEAQVINNP